jgi:hypothetical protein
MGRQVDMSRFRLRVTAAVAVVLAVAVGAYTPAFADDTTAVTVDTGHPAGRLPADFVGLSFEMRELGVGNLGAYQGNLVQLLRNLGRSNIRISGNTLDRDTLWVPAGQQPPSPLPDWVQDVVTPNDIARLDGLLRRTGWRAEVGVNVGRYDAALAADEGNALRSILDARLAGAECGNEPNSWVTKGFRPTGYGYPQYRPEWEACANVVGSVPLAGPDTSSPNSTGAWFTSFAQDDGTRLAMLTQHAYSIGATGTVADLLSPATDASEVHSIAAHVAAARAAHLPIRLDETNSAAGGGIKGVSDTYASALWAMDYSLLMAQDGVDGLNFHGGLGVCGAPLYNGKFQLYTPVCAANSADEQAKVYVAAPEYYGLLMASRMGPGTFLPVAIAGSRNVTAYAVRGDDGRTRIALIEKDDTATAPVPVSVNVGVRSGIGQVLHLTGPSLTGADGIAIQGASVDRSGRLAHRPADLVRVHDGVLSLTLAPGSAVIVTVCGD